MPCIDLPSLGRSANGHIRTSYNSSLFPRSRFRLDKSRPNDNNETSSFLSCIGIDYSAGTLYANQRFVIQFKFPKSYPLESPEVIFVGSQIPIHPHIYSNGHICLSILYDQWSPALKVSTVCLSVLSMLSSCTKKEPPSDDKSYVISASKSPKDSVWDFHDESV